MDRKLWDRFASVYKADLLPFVIDSATPISPKSSLEGVGKVPSTVTEDGVRGIRGWSDIQTTDEDIRRYKDDERLGIMMVARTFKAISIQGVRADAFAERDRLEAALKGDFVQGFRGLGNRANYLLLLRTDEDLSFRVPAASFEVEAYGNRNAVILAGGPLGYEWPRGFQRDLASLPAIKSTDVRNALNIG